MGEIRLLAKAGRNKEIRELLEVEDEKIVIDKDSNGKEIGKHVETYKVHPVDETNAAGRTALIEAASAGHTKTAGLLIDAGADVNAQQAQGYSPLWLASYKGHPEMVKLLLAAGADKAIESSRNKLKAIDVVCQGGNAEPKEKSVAMVMYGTSFVGAMVALPPMALLLAATAPPRGGSPQQKNSSLGETSTLTTVMK